MTDHIGDANKMVADHPGVQGLAQLGRNAIDRVGLLEREVSRLSCVVDHLCAALRRVQTRPAEESAFIAASTLLYVREKHGVDS